MLPIVVLAGGRSSRFGSEKALAPLNGKRLIDIVYSKANAVADRGEAYVAVSKNAPKTREYCIKKGYNIIETHGNYISDLKLILNEVGVFVSVACDLPFLKEEDIIEIAEAYNKLHKSLVGVLPAEKINFIEKSRCLVYNDMIVVGLNVVSEYEDFFFFLKNKLLAVNINTPEDLILAEKLAKNFGIKTIL